MPAAAPQPHGGDYAPSVLARLAVWQRAGGIVLPATTALLAFVFGGLVVAATGKNPLTTYRAIFDGTGLNWLFPWVTGAARANAAINLQQTLLITTSLVLTGLAVAFAFRCGLFNIGGQGQYLVGSYFAVWVGSSLAGLPGALHVLLAVAVAALAVYWVVVNRTTLGFQVRAVGFNPEAARYGGIHVARNYVYAMAISGLFAGLAGAVDVLGWQFRISQNDVTATQIGFIGIAVALLGRNTTLGTFFA